MTLIVKTPTCTWTHDHDYDDDYWETGCGETFTFLDGGPMDNGVKFCPFCGKAIEIVIPEDVYGEDDASQPEEEE